MDKYALSQKEIEAMGGKIVTLHASALESATGDSKTTKINVAHYKEGVFFLEVTVDESTTADKLDVTIVTQDPVSGAWHVIATFTQKAGDAGASSEMEVVASNLGEYIAAVWTIIDDSASAAFTFSIGGFLKTK